MALGGKPKKNGLWHGTWQMKGAELESSYIKVTENNRKNAAVIGRIFYVIRHQRLNLYSYCGFFTIEPCYFQGVWQWPYIPFVPRAAEFKNKTHYRISFDSNKSRDEWGETYKKLIDNYIKDGCLYINPKDPILTYIKE